MKRSLLPALAAVAAALGSNPALALGRLADLTLIDRDTGQTLTAHGHGGEYWVEGRPGARYAIRIRNATGERVLAVASVDGVNIVTGETAAAGQRGYIFDPWSGYDITGWRKSDAQVAAFEFTSVARSYAARTGRAENVGVIGVALFREKERPRVELSQAPPALVQPAAAARGEAGAESRAAEMRAQDATASAQRAPALGTGHGAREDSWVTQVAFERAREQPDELIRLRYDSHANLVAMGVIREPRPPQRPEPFPAGPKLGYVPDP